MEKSKRETIIAANWKMHKNKEQAAAFCREFLPLLQLPAPETVIIPPALLIDTVKQHLTVQHAIGTIAAVRQHLAGSSIKLGVQNLHWAEEGAYTGEISAPMAADAGCQYCLCGHSERRQHFNEQAAVIAKKAQAARKAGLRPIICLGESGEERNAGQALAVLEQELTALTAGLEAPDKDIVIAYEPVWAIGTGVVAAPEDAEEAAAAIRRTLVQLWGKVGEEISILYGGSVNPENIRAIMACPNIDGVLVGGASLKAEPFAALVNHKHPAHV